MGTQSEILNQDQQEEFDHVHNHELYTECYRTTQARMSSGYQALPFLKAWEQGYFNARQVMGVTPITIVLRAVTGIVSLHTVDMGAA